MVDAQRTISRLDGFVLLGRRIMMCSTSYDMGQIFWKKVPIKNLQEVSTQENCGAGKGDIPGVIEGADLMHGDEQSNVTMHERSFLKLDIFEGVCGHRFMSIVPNQLLQPQTLEDVRLMGLLNEVIEEGYEMVLCVNNDISWGESVDMVTNVKSVRDEVVSQVNVGESKSMIMFLKFQSSRSRKKYTSVFYLQDKALSKEEEKREIGPSKKLRNTR
ncbi:hypothetical protein V6N11_069730 [Hibiscus sabdariffa]|uniref:Uncharacterized protein n=1 Tax=Hibiscus sabdariffa TaxID=183260 RepID=A0ABR2Q3L8_9ROSI